MTLLSLVSGAGAAPLDTLRSSFELTVERLNTVVFSRALELGELVRIGREPECDVFLDDQAVSREHARLRVQDDGLEVEDCSRNGTLADGQVVRGTSTRVAFGRPILVGASVLRVSREAPDLSESAADMLPAATEGRQPSSDELRDTAAETSSAGCSSTDALVGTPIELRREVHRLLLEHLDMNAIDPTQNEDPALRPRVLAALRRIARMLEARLPEGVTPEVLVGEVADEALGLGPLERLLADPTVSEIMVVDAQHIFVERAGRLSLSAATFTDEERVRAVIERIVTPLGRRIDESSPLVDARLPDGSRVNVVIRPLALRGSCITIRKFARTPVTVEKLLEFGALSPAMARFLARSVRARKNILISGGTGSGKTTLLNVLSAAIPDDERIVTIEDAAELQLGQPHVVSLESRPANMEGKGEIAIRELVKNALRMRPDRIVVGECRGGEALDMLQAMNTGHDGSLTTTHANSPGEALMRIETLALMAGVALPSRAIREQIAKSIHLVVQQSRLSDGSRKLTAISEVAGLDHDGNLRMRPLFEFVRSGTGSTGEVEGAFEATGYLPSFLPDMLVLGLFEPGERWL